MPDPDKTLVADMEAESPEELHTLQCHDLVAVISVIVPAEGHTLLVHLEDAVIGDGRFVGVTPQVFHHHLGPGKGRLGVDDPVVAVQLSAQCLIQLCNMAQALDELAPENPREDLYRKEVNLAPG